MMRASVLKSGHRTHLLRRDVVVNSCLQLLAYALCGDGLEVGLGQDLVDDGRVGRYLLRRDCRTHPKPGCVSRFHGLWVWRCSVDWPAGLRRGWRLGEGKLTRHDGRPQQQRHQQRRRRHQQQRSSSSRNGRASGSRKQLRASELGAGEKRGGQVGSAAQAGVVDEDVRARRRRLQWPGRRGWSEALRKRAAGITEGERLQGTQDTPHSQGRLGAARSTGGACRQVQVQTHAQEPVRVRRRGCDAPDTRLQRARGRVSWLEERRLGSGFWVLGFWLVLGAAPAAEPLVCSACVQWLFWLPRPQPRTNTLAALLSPTRPRNALARCLVARLRQLASRPPAPPKHSTASHRRARLAVAN